MIRLRRIIYICSVALLVGLCLGGLSLLVLPNLIESWMLPQLAQQLGYADFDCRINHLGPTETSAGPLRLGPESEPALTIERIRLLYSPGSMAEGELNEVILSGVCIKTRFDKGRLSITGFENNSGPAIADENNPDQKPATRFKLPPLPFTTLTIWKSVILIKTDDREFRLPFSCRIKKSTAPGATTDSLNGTLQLNPRGNQIALKFTLPLAEKKPAHLELQGNKIELSDFADILGQIEGLQLKGQTAFMATAELELEPLGFEKLKARIEWQRGKLSYNNFHIDNSGAAASQDPPTILSLNKDEVSAPWQFKINRLTLAAPLSPTLTDLDISIKQESNTINLQAYWTTRLSGDDKAKGLTLSGFTLKEPFSKKWQLSAKLDRQGDYNASLSSPADNHKWQLQNESLSISGKSPAIRIEAHSQKPDAGKLNWQISFNQTLIKDAANHFSCPLIKASGQAEINSANRDFATSTLAAARANCECRKILLNKKDLGRFNATLRQSGEKFRFKGRYASKFIKELKLLATGEFGFKPDGRFQARTILKIPACKPAEPFILGRLIPAAGRSTLNGTLKADGQFTYNHDDNHADNDKLNGALTVELNDADFHDPEKNLACSGINCRITFPELPSLQSVPNQKLTFNHLQSGNIICDGGTFAFQIERDQTLLLEKGRLKWCDGNVETQALRISPTIDHYQSTIYCDRLQLAELLQQLGQVEAQGQGSVNGRIPITWDNGKITFADGFLYSTPNQVGTIKIKSGNTLTAGLPTNSPQFAQLDLAREALKDYQYKWAKLKLNSAADELILNLQFDGKPNQPLPFVYREEVGGFVRVTSTGPGSHFQGISLDINLRLPLNRILQYKDLSTILK